MRASMHGEVADTRSKEKRQCGPQDSQLTLSTIQPGLCLLCPTMLLLLPHLVHLVLSNIPHHVHSTVSYTVCMELSHTTLVHTGLCT